MNKNLILFSFFAFFVPSQCYAECVAWGSNLKEAKNSFVSKCGPYSKAKGHDCDPVDGGFVCSTLDIQNSDNYLNENIDTEPEEIEDVEQSSNQSSQDCSVTGRTLSSAKQNFSNKCGFYDKNLGHDCDPSGSGWVCSNNIIGTTNNISNSSENTSNNSNTSSQPIEDNEVEVSVDNSQGIIVIEAENTSSPRGEWIFNNGHITFDGNSYKSGPVNSPLEYKFLPSKSGVYTLTMKVKRYNVSGHADYANDGYVKILGDLKSPVSKPSTADLKNSNKLFGGGLNFIWTGRNPLEISHSKYEARYELTKGKEYTFVLAGRSKGWSVDKIVLYHSSVPVNVAQSASASDMVISNETVEDSSNSDTTNLNDVSTGTNNNNVEGVVKSSFDKSKDLLALHYDHAPDKDDGHAVVAGKVLVDHFGVNAVMVHGAYGIEKWKHYQKDSLTVVKKAWGTNFINAVGKDNKSAKPSSDNDWRDAVENEFQIWKNTLDIGGHIWVAEGGPHDFTSDVVRTVRNRMPHINTFNRITVVQHSGWNMHKTDINNLRLLTGTVNVKGVNQVQVGNSGAVNFIKIHDGNQRNQTADFNMRDDNFVRRAKNSKFGDAWTAAFNFLNPFGNIPQGPKLDFSDTVEVLYILGVGTNEVIDTGDFADKFF